MIIYGSLSNFHLSIFFQTVNRNISLAYTKPVNISCKDSICKTLFDKIPLLSFFLFQAEATVRK